MHLTKHYTVLSENPTKGESGSSFGGTVATRETPEYRLLTINTVLMELKLGTQGVQKSSGSTSRYFNCGGHSVGVNVSGLGGEKLKVVLPLEP